MTTRGTRTATVAVVAAALAVGTAAPALAAPAATASGDRVGVIVQELPGAGDRPERAVAAAGGAVGRQLGIIDAFTAQLPAERVGLLRAVPGVLSVTEDARVDLADSEVAAQTGQSGSLHSITQAIGATDLWARGITGKGIDIAMIDSGVVPVEGLRTPGKLVHGPDLSMEAQECNPSGVVCTDSPAYALDGYGHGTAMAGIMAGRDDAAPATLTATSGSTSFLGVAPDARVVSVKVADASGASDVSQVIAGIDWVVQNRNRDGLNIRVLSLSFGTDGVQDYQLDPLTHAAEVAWRNGIVVVVSAGNSGSATGKLTNPAYDPYLLAVGAVDDKGTNAPSDDVIPSWSSRGDGVRNPDVVAPGAGVVSLRAPGSLVDLLHPEARVGSRFLRGNGTSQAAAVAAGAVALLLQQRPDMHVDQAKALLRNSARAIKSADRQGQGRGMVDLARSLQRTTPSMTAAGQSWAQSTGTGSLEAARGTTHVHVSGVPLVGERDVTGALWNATSRGAAAAASWSGGTWNGRPWFGNTFNADHYGGQVWNGSTWVGTPWEAESQGNLTARTWAGQSWSEAVWAARTWAASDWAARTWAARTWAARTWATATWG